MCSVQWCWARLLSLSVNWNSVDVSRFLSAEYFLVVFWSSEKKLLCSLVNFLSTLLPDYFSYLHFCSVSSTRDHAYYTFISCQPITWTWLCHKPLANMFIPLERGRLPEIWILKSYISTSHISRIPASGRKVADERLYFVLGCDWLEAGHVIWLTARDWTVPVPISSTISPCTASV